MQAPLHWDPNLVVQSWSPQKWQLRKNDLSILIKNQGNCSEGSQEISHDYLRLLETLSASAEMGKCGFIFLDIQVAKTTGLLNWLLMQSDGSEGAKKWPHESSRKMDKLLWYLITSDANDLGLDVVSSFPTLRLLASYLILPILHIVRITFIMWRHFREFK